MKDLQFAFDNVRMHAQAIITYGEPVGADYATGSITYGAPDVGDTVIVDGNTFTCVASGAGAGEFSDITELEALVEAVTGVNSAVDGGDINITAAARGVAGNAITLALGVGNTGTMDISGATLTGGVDGDTITVDSNLYTCVVGTAGSDEFSDADELAALIDAESGLNAANADGVITVNVDAVGTAGNSKEAEVGEANAGTMEVTQQFSGGAAALYTDAFDLPEDADSYEVTIRVTALDGGSPTADFTCEGSSDGGSTYQTAETDAEASVAIAQITSAPTTDKQIVDNGSPRNRLKLVLGGTSPTLSGTVSFISRND